MAVEARRKMAAQLAAAEKAFNERLELENQIKAAHLANVAKAAAAAATQTMAARFSARPAAAAAFEAMAAQLAAEAGFSAKYEDELIACLAPEHSFVPLTFEVDDVAARAKDARLETAVDQAVTTAVEAMAAQLAAEADAAAKAGDAHLAGTTAAARVSAAAMAAAKAAANRLALERWRARRDAQDAETEAAIAAAKAARDPEDKLPDDPYDDLYSLSGLRF